MKTIRNSVIVGVSLLSGCAHFDTKHLVHNGFSSSSDKESVRYMPKDFGDSHYTNQTHWDTRY
ncbi:hypothetical protein [Helicobacter cetorum]|uniref:hypothetical protein n=1 Tax=Helicobacter cetorum TaxID=138563 RepID=UPI000CF1925F|nr:hypothetical protein [Helicobacter cetorum]